ncbi:MAG: universal stress protein, partial [Anaerolineales bacterium]|nr:universal stress protein [Anaerolineales bacterium]
IEVGRLSGAALTLLHVVPPLESEHLPLREFDEKREMLIDADSAHILRAAQQDALDNGITVNVVVRHGNVVNQILAELKSKKYDLICMGSSFSDPDNLRHLYAPNVTAEIAEAVNCPVLTARNPMQGATSG